MNTKKKSTIEKKCKTRKGFFRSVDIKTSENGSMDLILPEIPEDELIQNLPNVSVITITKNRGLFIGLMLFNWMNIKYPREKLEWIILDDSDDSYEYNLADYIPQDDPYIKYTKLNKSLNVADKRNRAVELANYDYIVHMDDDDYYFSDHVLAKIRIILQYNVQGVHSFPIGVYDMMNEKSYIFDPRKDKTEYTNNVAEATLAYRKDYWTNNKFMSIHDNGISEGTAFINNNFDKWINLHFMFNMISITHTKNITGNIRSLSDKIPLNSDKKVGNFKEMFPQAFLMNLENVKNMLK